MGKHTLILFLLLFAILVINLISALGVSPGIIEFDFQPNAKVNFDMQIYNMPAKDQNAEVYVNYNQLDKNIIPEFENIVEIGTKQLSFSQDETSNTSNIIINFPAGFSTAGKHELRIGARPAISSGDEGIQVIAGNEIRVFINVAPEYASDKFAKIKRLEIINIEAPNVIQGEEAMITANIKSKSDTALSGIYAEVNVSRGKEQIEMLKTNEINLEPQEQGSLKTSFNTKKIVPGVLNILVEVFYDSRTVTAQTTMEVLEKQGIIGSAWFWVTIVIFIILLILFLIFLLREKKKKNDAQEFPIQEQPEFQQPQAQQFQQFQQGL